MLKDQLLSHEAEIPQEAVSERERRRALGIYYTPPEAAKVLARWTIRNTEDKILEPSFGGCALLSAAVSVFKALGNNHPSKQMYGYDVDATAFAHLAQVGIDNTERNFKKQDFLSSHAAELQVDAVLANPPFVSYHRLNEHQRKVAIELGKRYLPTLPRIASLWAYFVLHAMSFLRAGGRMAFVLPNAVGTANYARPLLEFLLKKFRRVELVHVSERLFIQAGADERISILLLSEYTPASTTAQGSLISKETANIRDLDISSQLDFLPIFDKSQNLKDDAEKALHECSTNHLLELGSVATVRIGEVVGDVRFFVRSREEWLQHNISSKHLLPLLTRSAQARGISISKKEIENGSSSIPYLLLPTVKQQSKAVEEYISQYPKDAIEKNKTFSKRPLWFQCSYSGEADAFIGSISHDFPRIIGNRAGISCSNAFYKIQVPDHPKLARWLPLISLTTPFRLSAEILGRVRGSGGIKLEPSEVKKLKIPGRLPDIPNKELDAIELLVGAMLSRGEIDTANQLADSYIFLQTNLIDSDTLSYLRKVRLNLTNRRLARLRN